MEIPNEIPFNTCMTWLRKFYVIPKKNILTFICVCLLHRALGLIFVIGGSFMHLVKTTKENVEGIDASEDVVVVSSGVGIFIGLSIFSYHHKEWIIVLNNIMDFSNGKPQNIDKQIKFGNYWARCLGYFYIVSSILYGVITILEAPNCNQINEERGLHLICDSFVPIWFPFDFPKKIHHYILFLIQLALVIVSVCSSALVCFLIYEATEMLGLHIEHLNDHFRKIISKRDVRERSDGMGYWVRYHNHIIKLADSFRILAKKCTAHITMMSALIFGCGENQLVKGVKPLGALLFLISWMIPMLLLCHSGEILMNFSLSIHDVVRDSNWYKASPAIQRDVVLILMRCQKPLHLDTLPLGAMNYSLFLLLLRTSYSYMTLLKQAV